MNKWFYLNMAVLLFAIWKVFHGPLFFDIPLHILFGFIGLVLLLFNWTRHAVFSTIRQTPDRDKKIKYANVSKKVRIIHRWTGSLALIAVIIHLILVTDQMSFHLWGNKAWSGLAAFMVVFGLVVSGWLRLYFPTGPKRFTHLILGFCLFYFLIIHLLF